MISILIDQSRPQELPTEPHYAQWLPTSKAAQLRNPSR